MELLDEGGSSDLAGGVRGAGLAAGVGRDGVPAPSAVIDVDPLAQRFTMEIQASMRRGDEPVEEETLVLAMTLYTANHIELMLRVAGFEDIELRDDWTDAEPTRERQTWCSSPGSRSDKHRSRSDRTDHHSVVLASRS